jgi:O-methyltransferase involved in polyketide biosynthesis
MTGIALQTHNPVVETLLIPLCARAREAQEATPLLHDDRAVALVGQLDCDLTRYKLSSEDQAAIILRNRQFDRYAREFVSRHPNAIVVQVGCGLDTRYERLAQEPGSLDGVTWYDLDLPEVIAVRRQLLSEGPGHRFLPVSIFDGDALDAIAGPEPRPTLFLAEAVLLYFEAAQVKQLFLTLAQRFPGSELVCDAMTPLMIRSHNLQMRLMRMDARLRWGLPDPHEPEHWGAGNPGGGIRLLNTWYYFDTPEPRLGASQWMRHFPPFGKGAGIYHYRLGEPVA